MSTHQGVYPGLPELQRFLEVVSGYLAAQPGQRLREALAEGVATDGLNLAGRVTLRPDEAAQATGLSLATIRRSLHDGTLRSKKLRDMRLIKVVDLIEFVDALEDA